MGKNEQRRPPAIEAGKNRVLQPSTPVYLEEDITSNVSKEVKTLLEEGRVQELPRPTVKQFVADTVHAYHDHEKEAFGTSKEWLLGGITPLRQRRWSYGI